MKTARGRGRHPLVEACLRGEADILSLLRGSPEPREPTVGAMLGLREAYSGRGLEAALAGASSLKAPAKDPNLYLLFLGLWAHAAVRAGRGDEARVLIARARNLVRPGTPPDIEVHILWAELRLAGREADLLRMERLHAELHARIPEASFHRRDVVLNRALFLARLGRGVEVETDLRWLEGRCDGRMPESRVALIRFVNAVETGRAAEAESLLPRVEADPWFSGVAYRIRRAILEAMQGRWRDGLPPHPGPAAVDFAGDAGQWVVVLQRLLDRRPAEALSWARAYHRPFPDLEAGGTFTSLNLIRAELACGNHEAARHLLDLRRNKGNRHYLDEFFLARADLDAGNPEAAARRFAEAEAGASRNRAEGRLNFELRMACEIEPWDLLSLGRAADRIAKAGLATAAAAASGAPAAPPEPAGLARLIGESPALQKIRELTERLSKLDVPVLITGETGTGKELIARALHEAGPRAAEPFVAVNCGAIAETLLEPELFGHERGAFTGADRARGGVFDEAGKGTIFLDEIGEVSPRLQVLLLRVLETGEVRPVGGSRVRLIGCRVVMATNAVLAAGVAEGRFRSDLYYRLRRIEIEVPPLRERPEDVLPIARHFLDLGRRPGVHAEVSAELAGVLRRCSWPGNVRELRNEMERMRVLGSDRLAYGIADLDGRFRSAVRGERPGAPETESEPGPPPGFGEGPAGRERRAGEETGTGGEPGWGPSDSALSGGLADDGLRGGAGDPATGPRPPRSTLRRRERIKDLFRRRRLLTRIEIAEAVEISGPTATADLQALRREGFIRKVEPGPSPRTHYFVLNEALKVP